MSDHFLKRYRLIPLFFGLLTSLTGGTMTVSGDVVYMTVKEKTARADLVCTGRLTGYTTIKFHGEEIKVGIIRITEVLKGDKKKQTIYLRLPPAQPHGMRLSTDIELAVGQTGLWFLKGLANNLFQAERPDSFIPEEQAEKEIEQIKGNP